MQVELKTGRVHIDGKDHALKVIDMGRSVGAGIEPSPGVPMVTFFVSPASGSPKITVEMPTTDAVRFASALLDTVTVSEGSWRGKFGEF